MSESNSLTELDYRPCGQILLIAKVGITCYNIYIMKNTAIIAVIGAGRCNKRQYAIARSVGQLIASQGAMLISGGLGGVMEAASRGAKEAGGLTIGILPSARRADANAYIDIIIPSGLGEARNLLIVNSAQAVIAIGGGYGTLSEIAFALKSNTPLIGINTWQQVRQGKAALKIVKVKTAARAVETVFARIKDNAY